MKFFLFSRVLRLAARAVRPHDDLLRAGEFRKPAAFTPWTLLVR